MSESKKSPPMRFEDVKSGLALIGIGRDVSLRLVSDRRCFIKVNKQGHIELTPNSDIVDLQIISEDKALQICCILGLSDEEMLSLMRRRSAQDVVDKTVDASTGDLSS